MVKFQKAVLICMAALSICSIHTRALSHEGDQEWYVGSYVGKVSMDGTPATITLNCLTKTACEYAVHFSEASHESGGIKTNSIEMTDVRIPNANLKHMRDVLAIRPGEYEHDRNGPLLQLFRPVIDSSAKFDACVGQSEMHGAWWHICKLDQKGKNMPDAVLLLTTMNPACGTQVICAYMMFPLHRIATAHDTFNQ